MAEGATRDAGFVAKFLGGTLADKPEVYRDASPIEQACNEAPPFLFLHGTADKTIPIEQSQMMLKKLRHSGIHADIYEVDGADHAFFFKPPHFESTLRSMELFLDQHFSTK